MGEGAPNLTAWWVEVLWASGQGNAGLLRNLLSSPLARQARRMGWGPEGRDTGGKTALIIAAERGHLDCVELLLVAGSDPDARDDYGRSAHAFGFAAESEPVTAADIDGARRLLAGFSPAREMPVCCRVMLPRAGEDSVIPAEEFERARAEIEAAAAESMNGLRLLWITHGCMVWLLDEERRDFAEALGPRYILEALDAQDNGSLTPYR